MPVAAPPDLPWAASCVPTFPLPAAAVVVVVEDFGTEPFAGVAFGVAAGFDADAFHCGFDEATVVPVVLSRGGRVAASVVVGRLALFDRFAPTVVELDAVDAAVVGRVAVARVCDVGRSFVTLVLLADAPVERAVAAVAAADDAVDVAFAGTLLDVGGGRVAGLLVVDADAAVGAEAAASLGAVERVVVC